MLTKKYFVFSLAVSYSFLLSGCFYPSKHVYFEPFSVQGMAYDGTWSEHISKENDAIKLTLKDIEIKIYHVYNRGKELKLSMFISPIDPILHSFSDRDSQVEYDLKLFKIKDNVSGKYYVPVNHTFFKRGSNIIYHQVSLEYLLDTGSISDFQLIFEKGALKLKSKNIKISPVKYKKKEVNTIGYFTINS